MLESEINPPYEAEKKYQENPALAVADMKKFVIEYMIDFKTKMIKNTQTENEETRLKFLEIEKKFDNHHSKLESILDEIQISKNKIDKINDLVMFSKKATDQLMTLEIKLNSLQKDFSNACYKYDKIFLDNLNFPGTIGDFCKYKNLRDYVEVIK